MTGIRFSDDRIRVLLRQEGFSFHRPKHTMKGKRDEMAYEKARKQLDADIAPVCTGNGLCNLDDILAVLA